MDEQLISKISADSSQRIAEGAKIKTHRDLYSELAKPTDYYVGIKGLRGIGKTTLLLQLAGRYKNPLYVSMDRIYVKNSSVYEIVKKAAANGFDSFFIDEIHSTKTWQEELKSLYDEGIRNLFFSGSSALGMRKGADLSRRAVLYNLKPAGFREWLGIKKGMNIRRFKIQDLIGNKQEVLKHSIQAHEYMAEYLGYGGMLFDRQEFDRKLENAVARIIWADLGSIREVDARLESAVMKILYMIATTATYGVNFSNVASLTGLSKGTVITLLQDLEDAGLIIQVDSCGKWNRIARKEPKIYLPIPISSFLCRQIMRSPEIGRLREEFFINHLEKICYVKGEEGRKTPDFMVNGKTFEVGGKGKDNRQAPDYIVTDSLVVEGNRIPLVLFGML